MVILLRKPSHSGMAEKTGVPEKTKDFQQAN